MFAWLYSFWSNEELGTGPGRNIFITCEYLQKQKKNLKSLDVIENLRQNSLLDDIVKAKKNLRVTPVLSVKEYFPPRHPVLRELLEKVPKCL